MGKRKGPRITARRLAWANDYMIEPLIEVRIDLEKILLRWKSWKWWWELGFPNAVFWNIWASSIRMEMNWDMVSVLEINISKLDSVRNGQTWGSSSHLDSALAWTPMWLAEGLTSHTPPHGDGGPAEEWVLPLDPAETHLSNIQTEMT